MNRLYLTYSQTSSDATFCGFVSTNSFTGKERDRETGFGYFGARYMDHELTSLWLSVDPMSDKYPSISPYAYCAWNPVKLVDPDGEDWYDLDINGKITKNEEKSNDHPNETVM